MTDLTNNVPAEETHVEPNLEPSNESNVDSSTSTPTEEETPLDTPLNTSTDVLVVSGESKILTIAEQADALSEETMEAMLKRFKPILEVISLKENPKHIAFIADVCLNHIALKYNDLSPNVSTWGVVVARKLFNHNVIIFQNQIGIEIDNFFKHVKDNLDEFMSTLSMSCSVYDAEVVFVDKYLTKRILNK